MVFIYIGKEIGHKAGPGQGEAICQTAESLSAA